MAWSQISTLSVWNGENRMVLASNAQHVVTYAYDHQGRMVAKVVNGSARHYFWDSYNIIHETINNQQSTITNAYVWGLDLSGSLQGAGGVGGLLAEIIDGVPYYAASDANGNVTEYISTNGVTEGKRHTNRIFKLPSHFPILVA